MKKGSGALKIFFWSLTVMSLQGCLYFNYGVKMTDPALKYRTYYYDDRNNKYDFQTVLFALEKDLGEKKSYTKFNISLSHMYKEILPASADKGKYVSEIVFDTRKNENIQLLPNSIRLTHKTKNGEVIPFKKVTHNLDKYIPGETWRCEYRQVYDPKSLPKKMVESIYLEFIINGETVKISQDFFIERRFEYSWWDVMMGV